MRKVVFLVLLMSAILSIGAKGKSTISGYVKDAQTGEVLIGATVFIEETEVGLVTNEYGFYSLTIPDGEYTVQFRICFRNGVCLLPHLHLRQK